MSLVKITTDFCGHGTSCSVCIFPPVPRHCWLTYSSWWSRSSLWRVAQIRPRRPYPHTGLYSANDDPYRKCQFQSPDTCGRSWYYCHLAQPRHGAPFCYVSIPGIPTRLSPPCLKPTSGTSSRSPYRESTAIIARITRR